MLFNSFEFAVFLPVMFFTCWFACGRSWQLQNLVLLAGSLVFYGWWDPRFLALILFSATLDFTVSNLIHTSENALARKALLSCSLLINFGILAVFKYCNFFIGSLNDALALAGFSPAAARLDLVLPVGISFYTFQTVSASIDVYRRQLQPTRNLIAWLAFITFFPQLVAGPIERAGHLLPQFLVSRRFSMPAAVDGCRQALWGLFKKIVIADNCAALANHAFEHSNHASAITLLAGIFLFTIQIYCDFSGYSDIAVGVARLFGFSLMQNFAFPYFSRDIAEFWRTLAHLTVHLVPRLPLPATRRQPLLQTTHDPQHYRCLSRQRTMARCQLDLSRMGTHQCSVVPAPPTLRLSTPLSTLPAQCTSAASAPRSPPHRRYLSHHHAVVDLLPC